MLLFNCNYFLTNSYKQMIVEKKSFKLTRDYIELKNLLKLVNLVQSGGEAKIRIQNGEAQLNGEIETQRGKKLYAGDVVVFDNVQIEIHA